MRAVSIAAAMSLMLAGSAFAEPAARPDAALADPVAEARARDLFADIRCVVCQHESISDSPAAIAADMRQLVREQIEAGRTDREIRTDLVRRYGDYVLFTPPFRIGTLLLWLGPLLLVAGAGLVFWRRARKAGPAAAPLTAEEEAELLALTGTDNGSDSAAVSDKVDI